MKMLPGKGLTINYLYPRPLTPSPQKLRRRGQVTTCSLLLWPFVLEFLYFSRNADSESMGRYVICYN